MRWRIPMLALLVFVVSFPALAHETQARAVGVVFNDRDGDGVRGLGEEGIPGVRVSNQRDVVVTDRNGRWSLPVDDDTILFVVKPSGWATPVDGKNLPRFYHVHKPQGSPELRYGGVAPTGPLPASVDFPLRRVRESEQFAAVFFGDLQCSNLREVGYVARDIVEPLIGTTATVAFTLGDNANDDLSVLEPLAETTGALGIPVHYVMGNHDQNYDAAEDRYADETWERLFGPATYSLDMGKVHFILLDNVIWHPPADGKRGYYTAGLTEKQLDFIRNDLAFVPRDWLVVLMFHIPLVEMEERAELSRILAGHRHTFSISAHWHTQADHRLTRVHGWLGPEPHHHLVHVTACGGWWTGAPDEVGIPHATMPDGVPNGYSIVSFNGNRYSVRYVPARLDPDFQVRVDAPETVAASELGVVVVTANVFAGSARSAVWMRVGQGAWLPMRRVRKPDPEYLRMHERDASLAEPYRRLPSPSASDHIWEARLPAGLAPGVHTIEVRTTDSYGQTLSGKRLMRVVQ